MKPSSPPIWLGPLVGVAWVAAAFGQVTAGSGSSAPVPRFTVPGHEQEMHALNAMHRLHYPPLWLDYPDRNPEMGLCTLWDEWLTGPCLWADIGSITVCDGKVTIPQRLRNSFLNKIIDSEGYVATHQHEGIGHVLGWPFPYWIGNPGATGTHFSAKGTRSAVLVKGAPITSSVEGWTLAGIATTGVDDEGLHLRLAASGAHLTTPPLSIDPHQSPFIQVRWSAKNLGSSAPFLEWETKEHPGFSSDRRMHLPAPRSEIGCEMAPVYRHPRWSGEVTRLRLNFANAEPDAEVVLQAIFTQYDTRHNINNFDFIRGCMDFFHWTGDLDFMRQALPRIRKALRFAEVEFRTRENDCVITPWVGHDGRSGIVRNSDGSATMRHGTGIGNNYWDLLPFGYKDGYASIRYYDTLIRMAELEREIQRHPEWNFPRGEGEYDATDLENHAARVKAVGNSIFWSDETGRFVAGPDIDGQRYDFGFTFLNLDAIYYGFASDPHALQIMEWIEGKRIVAGDTSTGRDIYHFRFGPRSTTRRNTDYYFWRWAKAHTIPFGGQVQDGGAVLGWSYMDLMSRLKVRGADNAWARLQKVTQWFTEVQAGGGYREYYRRQGAQLQGDGAAGGLGLDREFFESLLVPQVMIRGFLGLTPTADGLRIEPRLPSSFPSLSVDGIRIKGLVLSATAYRDRLILKKVSGVPYQLFTIDAPGFKSIPPVDWSRTSEIRLSK